ncbi:MAG: hypothetical protein PHW63_07230 [Alphaproteobacteria bacterium]|nr:hypothetical protein [Alphaproteobacteria bacterium]
MSLKNPHQIPLIRNVPNLPLGKDLILVLNLTGKAQIHPHLPSFSETLTAMNDGPDENIEIKRYGNLVVITQPEASLFNNGQQPCVDIFVPHQFRRLTMNLSGNAVVSGSAFPNATVIKAQDDAVAFLTTGDCFAAFKDLAHADITINPTEQLVNGRYVDVSHDLVLVSRGDSFKSYVNVMGQIGKAYMLFTNEMTGHNFAYADERHIFTPPTNDLNNFMMQSRVARAVRHKTFSPDGLQRKAAQMWRGFNACVRSKATARL